MAMTNEYRKSALLTVMVVARIATMLVAFKFLSYQFGPSGFGLLSQVMAVAALFSTFAGGGLSNGLVKEVAGSLHPDERASWLKAAIVISLGSAIFLLCASLILYWFGSKIVFSDVTLAWVFLLIGLAQIITGLGNTAIAYFSGTGAVSYIAGASILGNTASVAVLILGSMTFGFHGAVAGCAILAFAPSGLTLLAMLWKEPEQTKVALSSKLEAAKIRHLLHYSLSMVIAASAVPIVLIFMRTHLGAEVGWKAVGHWQAVARIGDAYIQVFGALFASLLLPRLSQVSRQQSLRIMVDYMPPMMGVFALGALAFWLLSPFILRIAYSDEFVVSQIYVIPQLVGDFFKILASFFVFRFLALGKPMLQAAGEVVQAAIMFIAFTVLLPHFGSLSAAWSYACGTAIVCAFAVGITFAFNTSLTKANSNE
jgi:O-antigen/teichoic acid export membrane protein